MLSTESTALQDPSGDSRELNAILSTLEILGLVDAPPEEAFDKFTRLVTQILDVPVAIVSVVQEDLDRQFFKSQIGLPEEYAKLRQTPLSHSFCQHVKQRNRPLIVENAPEHVLVCENMAITDLGVKAYLGVPFHDADGVPLGALAAIDGTPRRWSDRQIGIMIDLADCVTDQIKLRAALARHYN